MKYHTKNTTVKYYTWNSDANQQKVQILFRERVVTGEGREILVYWFFSISYKTYEWNPSKKLEHILEIIESFQNEPIEIC